MVVSGKDNSGPDFKTRILFVDDEPAVRELFPRMIATIPGQWETRCVESGEKALEELSRERFDLVVSDMRMPGMSGSELLNEVVRLYPSTGRMIISGYAERNEILRCVGSAHQFLPKPIELPALQAALRRIRNLREGLRFDEVRKLVAHNQSLPPLPAIFLKLLQLLQDPNCSLDEVGQTIATDAALTARVLQLVNSSFFGFGRQVTSATEAVTLLGTSTVQSLVLATKLFSNFQKPDRAAASRQQHWLWWHSMRVGHWARRIIELEQGDTTLAEEAFTAGVLHDVGQLILMDQMPSIYLELLVRAAQENRPKTELEREAFGATHAEAGAYLLDLWGLPAPLVETVAFHHEPGKSSERELSSLAAVHVANVLEAAEQSHDPGSLLQRLDGLYLDELGLGTRVQVWAEKLGCRGRAPADGSS